MDWLAGAADGDTAGPELFPLELLQQSDDWTGGLQEEEVLSRGQAIYHGDPQCVDLPQDTRCSEPLAPAAGPSVASSSPQGSDVSLQSPRADVVDDIECVTQSPIDAAGSTPPAQTPARTLRLRTHRGTAKVTETKKPRRKRHPQVKGSWRKKSEQVSPGADPVPSSDSSQAGGNDVDHATHAHLEDMLLKRYQRLWCLARKGKETSISDRIFLLQDAAVADKTIIASFAVGVQRDILRRASLVAGLTVGQQIVRDMVLANSVQVLGLFAERGWLRDCCPLPTMGAAKVPLWCWCLRNNRHEAYYYLVDFAMTSGHPVFSYSASPDGAWNDLLTELVAYKRLHWLGYTPVLPESVCREAFKPPVDDEGQPLGCPTILQKFFELTGAQASLFPWRSIPSHILLPALVAKRQEVRGAMSFFDRLVYGEYYMTLIHLRESGHLARRPEYRFEITEMIYSLARYRSLPMISAVWDLWMPHHLHTLLYSLEQTVTDHSFLCDFFELFAHRLLPTQPGQYTPEKPCPLCCALSLCLYYVPMALLQFYSEHFLPLSFRNNSQGSWSLDLQEQEHCHLEYLERYPESLFKKHLRERLKDAHRKRFQGNLRLGLEFHHWQPETN